MSKGWKPPSEYKERSDATRLRLSALLDESFGGNIVSLRDWVWETQTEFSLPGWSLRNNMRTSLENFLGGGYLKKPDQLAVVEKAIDEGFGTPPHDPKDDEAHHSGGGKKMTKYLDTRVAELQGEIEAYKRELDDRDAKIADLQATIEAYRNYGANGASLRARYVDFLFENAQDNPEYLDRVEKLIGAE